MRKRNEQITAIINYIENNLTNDISVSSVADYFKISDTHLNTLIKKYLPGVTIGEYIKNRKLDCAAEQILRGDKSIDEIATLYYSRTGFNQAFKDRFRFAPSEITDSISEKLHSEYNIIKERIEFLNNQTDKYANLEKLNLIKVKDNNGDKIDISLPNMEKLEELLHLTALTPMNKSEFFDLQNIKGANYFKEEVIRRLSIYNLEYILCNQDISKMTWNLSIFDNNEHYLKRLKQKQLQMSTNLCTKTLT